MHETMGQSARFERYAANLLYLIAAGQKLDTSVAERFGAQVDEVYKNPFKKPEKEMTTEDIKQYLLDRLQERG